MNSLVASEALKRVIMRNFARRNIRSKKGRCFYKLFRTKRGRRRYLFFDKNLLKKKKKRTRAPGGQSSGGQKKKKNLGKVTPQKETRDDRRRDQNDRERSDLPSPLPRFVVFSFHLSVFIPSARKGWRGEKKRERILKVCFSICHIVLLSFLF